MICNIQFNDVPRAYPHFDMINILSRFLVLYPWSGLNLCDKQRTTLNNFKIIVDKENLLFLLTVRAKNVLYGLLDKFYILTNTFN